MLAGSKVRPDLPMLSAVIAHSQIVVALPDETAQRFPANFDAVDIGPAPRAHLPSDLTLTTQLSGTYWRSPMSELGQNQTWRLKFGMSAITRKRTLPNVTRMSASGHKQTFLTPWRAQGFSRGRISLQGPAGSLGG
jgi:hypothetical protein